MNVSLGSGTAVHSTSIGSVLPDCGGNKASSRYRKTTKAVTCKKCLAMEAPAAALPAGVTTKNGKLYGPIKALRTMVETGTAKRTEAGDVIPA